MILIHIVFYFVFLKRDVTYRPTMIKVLQLIYLLDHYNKTQDLIAESKQKPK